MCYNKDISLYTYLIGLVASFLLLQKHFIRGLTLGSMNAGKG